MAFSIEFLDEALLFPFDDPKTPAAPGVLIMGDSKEGFHSSLYYWNKQQYESQWRRAIHALLNGSSKVALIIEYLPPEFASHLEWWAMYKERGTVYLQNHLLFYDQLPTAFSLDAPFIFLRDRETINGAGLQISEWNVSLSEVEQFAGMIGE